MLLGVRGVVVVVVWVTDLEYGYRSVMSVVVVIVVGGRGVVVVVVWVTDLE